MPKYTHNMVMNYLKGDVGAARDMQLEINPLVSALFCEVNPIPIKAALRAMGFAMGPLRLPLTEMSEAHHDNLIRQMRSFGLID